ncbi:hypothetical protein ACE38W_02505 [Chitinophaga sp. Hz27]|uniref:hypothetical protein n=1 Tax=Chitinophaga sp. Hz27 TaxID=3347169 RepID=UPI0035DB95C1
MRITSNYEEKAKQNLRDSVSLIHSQGYSSSINRSYYSCLQTIFHILFTKKKYEKKQFVADTKNNQKGSHVQAALLIGIELAKINLEDYYWFKRHFSDLKKLREKADYSEDLIDQEEVYQALRKAESIIKLIRKIP